MRHATSLCFVLETLLKANFQLVHETRLVIRYQLSYKNLLSSFSLCVFTAFYGFAPSSFVPFVQISCFMHKFTFFCNFLSCVVRPTCFAHILLVCVLHNFLFCVLSFVYVLYFHLLCALCTCNCLVFVFSSFCALCNFLLCKIVFTSCKMMYFTLPQGPKSNILLSPFSQK